MKLSLILIKPIIIMFMTMLLINIFNKINKFNSNKNFMNNIECGFNNLNNFKINYSMNFTYIFIIFIMFDIELMLIIPIIINLKLNLLYLKILNLFLMFMILSTNMELKNKKIIWMI